MNTKKINFISFIMTLTMMSNMLTVNAAALNQNHSTNKKYFNTVPQQLIVQFKKGQSIKTMSIHNHALTSSSHSLSHAINRTQFSVLTIKKNIDIATAFKKYKSDPSVAAVSYNYLRKLSFSPNDPSYSGAINQMWALHDTAPDLTSFSDPRIINSNDPVVGNDVNAEKAWDIWNKVPTKDKSNVVVAVIDSGVDYNHPELKDAMWDGSKATPPTQFHGVNTADNTNDPYPLLQYHGTFVSGIIAAKSNNGIGVPSIASGVKIMAIKVSTDLDSRITDSSIISGINYAVLNGADIINLSLGGKSPENPIWTTAMIDAVNAGVLIVVAAGNEALDTDIILKDDHQNDIFDWPTYYAYLPATKAGVISVAATDQADTIANFSNFGAKSVTIGAPGVNIKSTILATEEKPENIISGKNIPFDPLNPAQTGDFAGVNPSCSTAPNLCFGNTFFSNTVGLDCIGAKCSWGWVRDIHGLTIIADDITQFPNTYSDLIDGMITSQVFNTSLSDKVFLSFSAKWDLECDVDYVDVEVFDGTNWNILSGVNNARNINNELNGLCQQTGTTQPSKHTLTGRMGSVYNLIFGDEVIPSWKYTYNISKYNNPNLRIRFHFVTDALKNTATTTAVDQAVVINDIKITTQASDYSNAYMFDNGTSYASPLVAGIAALVKGANPSFTGQQIKAAIVNNADINISLIGKTSSGKRVNAFNAITNNSPLNQVNFISDNSGGCTLNRSAKIDPLIPALFLLSLFYWIRKKINVSSNRTYNI